MFALLRTRTNRSWLSRPAIVTMGLFLFVATVATADGVVTGSVLDGRTGLPVRGAQVGIEGLDAVAETDMNGVFSLSAPAGLQIVLATKDGYESQRILDVAVEDGGATNLSAVLVPSSDGATDDQTDVALSEEVTVTAEASDATETALLAERKTAAAIVDNIGAEEISKNTGSNAAAALKRVTGISLQDDKFIYVRGLGDRYSSTELNGSTLPSTEFDRKVVPLDLFPANMLDRVTVGKSYTVDHPGDFVAGLVSLETKKFPARQGFSVSVGGGHNSQTTGEFTAEYPGGLSASGSGGQALPASIPDEKLLRTSFITGEGFTAEELEAFGEQMIGAWTPERSDAPLGRDLSLSYGNTFKRLGLLLSATWASSNERREEERTFFAVEGGDSVQPLHSFDIEYGVEKVRRSLMGSFAYRLGNNSQIGLRVLDTELSNGEGRFQEGFFSDIGQDIQDFRVDYKQQQVSNFQLSGDHFFSNLGGGGSTFEWRAASSAANTDENLRQTIYEERFGEFQLSNQGQSGFFYFNELEDDLVDARTDWTTFFTNGANYGSLQFGGAWVDGERGFDGRRLRYFPRGSRGVDLTLSPEEIYTADNIEPFLFELREVTNATDSYSGTREVPAVYAQGDWSFGNWRVIGGLRFEDYEQQVVTFDRTTPDEATVTTLEDSAVLPAVSAVYALSDRQALRASLSRTVNRPEYRELAPFEFKHILGGFNVVGNPDLEPATIDSFDLRWEWFPSAREVVAASVFYKNFTDPIEGVVVGAAQLTQTYLNAEEAENIGFELELRRSLGSLFDSLEPVTAIVNYTYVESEISIPRDATILTSTDRPLAGQPDNVLNVVIEWAPESFDSTVRLLYNFTDDKVLYGGALGLPDVLEDGRSTLDLVWRQGLTRDLGLKLSASNLLDEDRSWSQGGETWRRYAPGRSLGLSLSYSR